MKTFKTKYIEKKWGIRLCSQKLIDKVDSIYKTYSVDCEGMGEGENWEEFGNYLAESLTDNECSYIFRYSDYMKAKYCL